MEHKLIALSNWSHVLLQSVAQELTVIVQVSCKQHSALKYKEQA